MGMRRTKQTDYLFVFIQLILFAIYFLIPVEKSYTDINYYTYFGTVILFIGVFLIMAALIQLNKNISALPTPVTNAQLITTGVFKFIRHPIYSGIFLSAFGFGLFMEDVGKMFLSIILLLFFDMKSNYEEEKLKEKFPGYTLYQNRTGKFTPPFFKSKS